MTKLADDLGLERSVASAEGILTHHSDASAYDACFILDDEGFILDEFEFGDEDFEFTDEKAPPLFAESTNTSYLSPNADPKPGDKRIGESHEGIDENQVASDLTASDLKLVPGDGKSMGNGKGLENAPTCVGREIQLIPIHAIRSNPNQPRRTFDADAHASLTASVIEHGIFQPILVRLLPQPGNDGVKYQIIAGERRWRACQAAGLPDIPAQVCECDDVESATIALIENLQREDLAPLEIADALQVMRETCSVRELAGKLGKKKGWVEQYLRLVDMSDDLRALVSGRPDTLTHARELENITDQTLQAELIAAVLDSEKPMPLAHLRRRIKLASSQGNSLGSSQGGSSQMDGTLAQQEATIVGVKSGKTENGSDANIADGVFTGGGPEIDSVVETAASHALASADTSLLGDAAESTLQPESMLDQIKVLARYLSEIQTPKQQEMRARLISGLYEIRAVASAALQRLEAK